MTDIFDGDKLVLIGPDGADYQYQGGQPLMDQGFHNHVNFALLTEPGWYGNEIEPVLERRISSKYIGETKKPVTRQALIDMDRAAELDVSGPQFGTVTAETTNPVGQQLKTELFFTAPANTREKLVLLKSGATWLSILNGILPPPKKAKVDDNYVIISDGDTQYIITSEDDEIIIGTK